MVVEGEGEVVVVFPVSDGGGDVGNRGFEVGSFVKVRKLTIGFVMPESTPRQSDCGRGVEGGKGVFV